MGQEKLDQLISDLKNSEEVFNFGNFLANGCENLLKFTSTSLELFYQKKFSQNLVKIVPSYWAPILSQERVENISSQIFNVLNKDNFFKSGSLTVADLAQTNPIAKN